MYRILRRLFFLLDAERAHYLAMDILKSLCAVPLLQKALARLFAPKQVPVTAFGLHFKNPVGLGAGFDKNALYLRELETWVLVLWRLVPLRQRPRPAMISPACSACLQTRP
jgi:dihydroorotate dehydrogenase